MQSILFSSLYPNMSFKLHCHNILIRENDLLCPALVLELFFLLQISENHSLKLTNFQLPFIFFIITIHFFSHLLHTIFESNKGRTFLVFWWGKFIVNLRCLQIKLVAFRVKGWYKDQKFLLHFSLQCQD